MLISNFDSIKSRQLHFSTEKVLVRGLAGGAFRGRQYLTFQVTHMKMGIALNWWQGEANV